MSLLNSKLHEGWDCIFLNKDALQCPAQSSSSSLLRPKYLTSNAPDSLKTFLKNLSLCGHFLSPSSFTDSGFSPSHLPALFIVNQFNFLAFLVLFIYFPHYLFWANKPWQGITWIRTSAPALPRCLALGKVLDTPAVPVPEMLFTWIFSWLSPSQGWDQI